MKKIFLILLLIPGIKESIADIVVDDNMIEITGEITQRDVSDFKTALGNREAPSVKLNSQGGDIFAALDIGEHLYNFEYMTKNGLKAAPFLVTQYCASACVFILASSRSRFVMNIGNFGVYVHRPYFMDTNMSYTEIKSGLSKMKERAIKQFERVGVSQNLWSIMMSTPAEEIRRLSDNELTDLGLNRFDPAYQDYIDGALAQKNGISKKEFLKRKSMASKCINNVVGFGSDVDECNRKAGLSNK